MTLNTFLGGDIQIQQHLTFVFLLSLKLHQMIHLCDYIKFMMMTTTKKTMSMTMTNLGETITLR